MKKYLLNIILIVKAKIRIDANKKEQPKK